MEISIAEFKKVYDLIGADFESWNGESFYFDKTEGVVEARKEKKLLKSTAAHTSFRSTNTVCRPAWIWL